MADEITLKDVYNIVGDFKKDIDLRFIDLSGRVEKYHDAFVKFEEGKLTQALQDIEKNKGDIKALETQNIAQNQLNTRNNEKRKDWIWEVIKNVVFMFIIPLIGLVLIKLGIINVQI